MMEIWSHTSAHNNIQHIIFEDYIQTPNHLLQEKNMFIDTANIATEKETPERARMI